MFFLIWRGWGILAVIIPIVLLALGIFIGIEINSDNVVVLFLPLIFLFFSAPAVWFLGVKLNNTPPRKLIDPKTNQVVIFKKTHSLFWIPMQYYGLVILGICLLALISKF